MGGSPDCEPDGDLRMPDGTRPARLDKVAQCIADTDQHYRIEFCSGCAGIEQPARSLMANSWRLFAAVSREEPVHGVAKHRPIDAAAPLDRQRWGNSYKFPDAQFGWTARDLLKPRWRDPEELRRGVG